MGNDPNWLIGLGSD